MKVCPYFRVLFLFFWYGTFYMLVHVFNGEEEKKRAIKNHTCIESITKNNTKTPGHGLPMCVPIGKPDTKVHQIV